MIFYWKGIIEAKYLIHFGLSVNSEGVSYLFSSLFVETHKESEIKIQRKFYNFFLILKKNPDLDNRNLAIFAKLTALLNNFYNGLDLRKNFLFDFKFVANGVKQL